MRPDQYVQPGHESVQAASSDLAFGFTAEGDARELAERAESQDAVLLFGPL